MISEKLSAIYLWGKVHGWDNRRANCLQKLAIGGPKSSFTFRTRLRLRGRPNAALTRRCPCPNRSANPLQVVHDDLPAEAACLDLALCRDRCDPLELRPRRDH